MKNTLKTSLLLLLSLCMVLSLGACKLGKGSTEVTTPNQEGTSQTQPGETEPSVRYDENGYELDDIPDGLDFEDSDFTILMWKESVRHDFVVGENDAGGAWSMELLDRQYAVEDRLNVTIKVEVQNGNWNFRHDFLAKVEQDQLANDKSSYDLIGTYTPTMANLASHGLMSDLNELAYVDTDKPWWCQQQVEASTINDHLYFLTGDITPTTVMTMSCVFGNEKLLQQYGHTELYDLVYDGEWTLSKMMELGLHNVNSNGGETDVYGITINSSRGGPLLHGAGMFYVERSDKGVYQLSDELTTQRAHNWFALLQDLFNNYDNVKHSIEKGGPFFESKSFFHMGTVGDLEMVKDSDFDYIVLPMPKYDKEQPRYYTVTTSWNTLYGAPEKLANSDMSGAVLEALASNAHRALKPVVFEECFSTRFVADPEDSAMVQLVYDSLVYDPAHMYAEAFGSLPSSFETVTDPTASWSNTLASEQTKWILKIASLNNELK